MENKSFDYSPHHKFSWWLIIAITLFIGFCFALSGCATGKNTNTGTQKLGALNDSPVEINPKVIAGVGNSNSETKTNLTAGGNIIQSNESKMIVELNNKVLETYKELTNKYIELMKYIIWTLFGAIAGALSSLISLVVWVIKFLLNQDKDTDEFMQKQITGK